MRMKGTLVEWNDDRGFGFVEPVAGGGRAFCHISQFALRSRRPVVGERVTYETSRDERGRLRALKIQPAHAPRANEIRIPPWMSPWVAVLVSVMFLISIGGLAVTGHLPWIAPVVYLLASVVTVVAYAFDKSAAMTGRWRTKESTLHLLALVGGWPGAWISQLLFRHKTVKSAFIAGFVLSVLLNLAALVWIVIEPHGPLGEFLWQIERP
jgi:uncharacterized membrane protein YsdA (DUF1294 family)/cold shock CspA family protein